jgi:2-polyprenyl-6-hydroxyphenyl methylase / 3-demethylubiquinone-9 3-methyltransferase
VNADNAVPTSVDPAEFARFSDLGAQFWDARGPMRMLHRINPARLGFIRDTACRQFARDRQRLDCLSGLRMLDVGCGAGVLCEPLARLGAAVVGIDPSATNVEAARRHAAEGRLNIDYRASTAEELAGTGERFDVVLVMEVVEHVTDMRSFLRCSGALVAPHGLLIAGTINRTMKSFALAIVGAEYLLGWLPRGTHRWDKLVRPEELEAALEAAGLHLLEMKGVVYDLLGDRWRLSDDVSVNYLVAAQPHAGAPA